MRQRRQKAAGALKETGLSAPDFISDSTSSIIWRSSVSLISIFHPLAKFIGIERARDIFNLFPALALQAVACCRTGIIVHVIHGREHLALANNDGGGMQVVAGELGFLNIEHVLATSGKPPFAVAFTTSRPLRFLLMIS